MATLTEETVQDKIEIVSEHKMIQIRTASIIKRDGVEISRSFSRHVVAPDADTSGESDDVKAIAAQVHTKAIKDAYAAHLESIRPE
tara:strand:+ start:785 stop:1042 length:258 start_codon:yes stop_codon:yes gene_type:complete